jgi:hypothetical protein
MLELSDVKKKSAVIEYLDAYIGDTPGIAAMLMDRIKFNPSIKALVPIGTDPERILKFEQGGLTQTSTIYDWICNRLKLLSGLEISKPGTFVSQDVWMFKADYLPHLSRRKTNVFFFDEKPYSWIPCSNPTIEIVTSLLNAPSNFMVLYAYSAHALESNTLKSGTDISGAEMELLTKGIREYYISAYDGESFIVVSTADNINAD